MNSIQIILAFLVMGMTFYGCAPKPETVIPPEPLTQEVADKTVGGLCELGGFQSVRVQGYSLVWGLPGTGSADCPPYIREALKELIKKTEAQKYMDSPYNTMTSDELIDSNSTAAVLVSGNVPAGVPKGNLFNVQVRIPWTSQTTTLQGGFLMPTDLREVVPGLGGVPIVRQLTAQAIGPIFTDPFADRKPDPNGQNLLQGVALGGGQSLFDRRMQLVLMEPDYRVSSQIQRRINARFGSSGGKKVANALNRGQIDIIIPDEYHDDYEHFIKVLLSLSFRDDIAFQKQKLQELNDSVLNGKGDLEQVSLEWEAIGRQAITYIEPFYENPKDEPAYYAARTALNLGHTPALGAMTQIALNDSHPRQKEAIGAIGKHGKTVRARQALIRLLDHPDTPIRLLAYEGLRRGEDPRIQTTILPGGTRLEIVESLGKPLIYVWADIEPRLILFGKGIACNSNVFYETPMKQITINAGKTDTEFTLIRTLNTRGEFKQMTCPMMADKLILALGMPLDHPAHAGLGLTFSQITAILKDFCENNVIPAEFYLHGWDFNTGPKPNTEP